jgi:hypothetical protein
MLKKTVKHAARIMQDCGECKTEAVRVVEELWEAKRQIRELNAVVNYLVQQAPHNGAYFDEVCVIVLAAWFDLRCVGWVG